MIEGIAMLTVLAGMGVYFIKSTDLPKDLKERSAQLKQESGQYTPAPKRRFAIPETSAKTAEAKPVEVRKHITQEANKEISKEITKEIRREAPPVIISKEDLEKAAAQKALREEALRAAKLAKIERQNKEIDELTMSIMTLEQEVKGNLKKNLELEIQINLNLAKLKTLKENRIS